MRRPASARTTARVSVLMAVVAPSLAILAAPALAASTTTGDVVVEQVGATGSSTALSSAATAVFLDEYSSTGTLVQSIAAPTAASGGQNALTTSGSATSEGQISNSADGRYVLVPGYDDPSGTAGVASSSSATVPRVIGRLDGTGTLDTSTSTNNAFSANNIRSASSKDGTVLTSVGGNSGVQSEAPGNTTSTPGSTGTGNLRVIHEFGTAELVSSSSGSTIGVSTVSGSTFTALPGVPTTGTSIYGFALVRVGTGPTFGTTGADTLYTADDSAGLKKYVWNGTTFVAEGGIATNVRGLAARINAAGNVEVFATTSTATSANTLVEVTDAAGAGALTGSFSTIATAPANTAFRGVAFAPQAPPTPDLPEVASAVLLPLSGVAIAGAFVWSRRRRTPATA